jgi:hypothetical protein
VKHLEHYQDNAKDRLERDKEDTAVMFDEDDEDDESLNVDYWNSKGKQVEGKGSHEDSAFSGMHEILSMFGLFWKVSLHQISGKFMHDGVVCVILLQPTIFGCFFTMGTAAI